MPNNGSKSDLLSARRDSAPGAMLEVGMHLHDPNPGAGPRPRHSMSQIAEDVRQRIRTINAFRLSSENSLHFRGPPVPNTYKMEPSEEGRFRPGVVRRTTEEVLEEALRNVSSYRRSCGMLSCTIAELVKNAVKTLCPRHKVVCHVVLMEDRQQGTRAVTRCLWDTDVDNMVTVTYVKNDLNVAVTVYGMYQE